MRTEEIVEKVFARSFMGYDIEQVDVFLDEVIEALERYEAEKQEMLNAMEYLMRKLERGQQVPLSDMKKAIDSGRAQPKKEAQASHMEEAKPAARSIARTAGSKPMRAPKVSRIKSEQETKERIIREAQEAQPALPPEEAEERAKIVAAAAANWLDELLINISDHESADFEKTQGAAQETSHAKEKAAETETAPKEK